MILLLLIPLGLCFLFVYWANSLEQEQEGLKWFFRLLSLFNIFIVFAGANIIITTNNSYPGLVALFNIQVLSWIFYSVIGVFLIFFIKKIFESFQLKKDDDFKNGVIK